MDSTGREFNRNRLIALLSAIVLEEVRYSNHFTTTVIGYHIYCILTEFCILMFFPCPSSTLAQLLLRTASLRMVWPHSLKRSSVCQQFTTVLFYLSVNFSLTQTCYRRKASPVQKRLQECHWWSYSLGNKSRWSYLSRTHALVPIVVRYLSCARLNTVSKSVDSSLLLSFTWVR